MSEWNKFGFDPRLLASIQKAGFETPTPVQESAIPSALAGKDIIVSAQTGTGKTAAFSFPLLEKFKDRAGTYGLVLAPSREIALQTKTVLDAFSEPLGIRSAALIGGVDIKIDLPLLKSMPQILVATPGRLCDHIERGTIWLEYLEVVVMDEADRMLEMGFSEQLNRIMNETSPERQTMLFSATMPPGVEKIAQKYMKNPERITLGRTVSPAMTVDQNFIFTNEESKISELIRLLKSEKGTVIIFTRSKLGASKLFRSLYRKGIHDLTQIHSNLEQAEREEALADFKSGKYRILIATDVIGRGIHVDDVAHVVNFDFPRESADYVHRVGRTGRAGNTGKATTFVTSRDRREVAELERLIKRPIRPDKQEVSQDRPPRQNSQQRTDSRPPRRNDKPVEQRNAEAPVAQQPQKTAEPEQTSEQKTEQKPSKDRVLIRW